MLHIPKGMSSWRLYILNRLLSWVSDWVPGIFLRWFGERCFRRAKCEQHTSPPHLSDFLLSLPPEWTRLVPPSGQHYYRQCHFFPSLLRIEKIFFIQRRKTNEQTKTTKKLCILRVALFLSVSLWDFQCCYISHPLPPADIQNGLNELPLAGLWGR